MSLPSTKESKFFYISDPLYQTVKDSQVINWLQLFEAHHITFDLLLITPLRYLFFNRKLRREKLEESKGKIHGRIFEVPIFKGQDPTGFSSILKFLFLFALFLPPFIKRKQIVVQTRNYTHQKILAALKSLFRIKLIFDIRGASAEEYLFYCGYEAIDQVKEARIRRKYMEILDKQIRMIQVSDIVFTVSGKLQNYFKDKIGTDSFQKIQVIPGAADQNTFYYDERLRKKKRKDLAVEDRFVICYTGKLDLPWHMADRIFELISLALRPGKNYFICITPDLKVAEKFVKKYSLDSNSILIKYEKYDQVNAYLNAADCGIILREDVPTNQVASPTKIAEYLLTGLPLLISKNLGDYSDFVFKYNFGIVFDNDVTIGTQLLEELNGFRIDRSEKSKLAGRYYSKQVNLEKLLKVFHEL